MNQINIQKKLGLSILYFFFGLYLTVEESLVELFFQIYFPDSNYRVLILLVSTVFGIAGFKKLQDATGINNIDKIIVAVQKEFANPQISHFIKKILSRYKLKLRDMRCVSRGFSSEEPMARKRSAIVVIFLCLTAVHLCILIFFFPDFLKINLSYRGLYDARFKIFAYTLPAFYIILISWPTIVSEIVQIKNALESAIDLKIIVKMLREELESWQIEYRVILPEKSNFLQQGKHNSSFILRLFKQEKKRDIDIVVTSPENNCCVIELKSHAGNVKWNSRLDQPCHQLGRNPAYVPFKKDPINQVKTQADKLRKHRGLTQMPDKILLFSRARIKLDKPRGKRFKSKVIISYPSQLVNDLRERNQELIKNNKC